jgi:hypothetical protein
MLSAVKSLKNQGVKGKNLCRSVHKTDKKTAVKRKKLNGDVAQKVLLLGVKTVLFICTHNSARSQMAEAFLNKLCEDKYEAKIAALVKKAVS